MKLRINLLIDELKPKKDPINLNNISLLWMIILVICLSYGSGVYYFSQQQNKKLFLAKSALSQQTAQIAAIEQELLKKQNKNVLSQQLNQLNIELTHKNLLLDYMKGRNQDEKVSYAAVMTDLSKYRHKDIWLTEFSFMDHKIELKGSTQKVAQLPHWLDGLKQSSFFSGQKFSVFSFDEEQSKTQQIVKFHVASVLNDGMVNK